MATTNNRDVQLIIRARDEASKAVGAITSALGELTAAQSEIQTSSAGASSKLAMLGKTIQTIDTIYAKLSNSVDASEQSFVRQQRTLRETQSRLAGVRQQAEAAAEAIVATKLNLDQNGGRAASVQLQAAQTAYRELNSEARRLESALSSQQNALARSEGSLSTARSAAIAAGVAVRELGDESVRAGLQQQAAAEGAKAAHEQFIAKLRQEEQQHAETQAAAERAAAAQRRINAVYAPGLSRAPARTEADVRAAFAQDEADTIARLAKKVSDKAAADRQSKIDAEAAARADDELTAAAKRLRHEIDPLLAVTERLNQKLAEARRLKEKGKISSDELAKAEKALAISAKEAADALNRQGRGTKATPALFGLRPYELTNLGYQINDLVTQVASGTSLTQALAQQGGQILQLFPRLGEMVIALLPKLLLIVPVVTTIFFALKRIADLRESMREFNGLLAANADGAIYQSKALVKSAEEIDKFGASSKEATAAVKTFVKEGVAPEKLVQFGQAAQNFADVMGKDLKDAVQSVATAFTAGYEEIKEFDKTTNFLTASEREQVRVLFESGKAAEARTLAFGIFYERQDEAARQTRGPWTDAVRALEGAWKSFINFLSTSNVLNSTASVVTKLADGVTRLLDRIKGIRSLATIEGEIADIEDRMDGRKSGKVRASLIDATSGTNAARDLAELKLLFAEREALIKRMNEAAGKGDPRADRPERQKKVNDDVLEAQRRELDLANAVTDAQKVKVAGERAYVEAKRAGADEATRLLARERAEAAERQRILDAAAKASSQRDTTAQEASKRRRDEYAAQYKETVEGIEGQISALRDLAAVEKLTVDQKFGALREAAIAKALQDQENKARKAGLTVTAEMAAEIRSLTGRLFDLQNAQRLVNEREVVANEEARKKRDFIRDTIALEAQREISIKALNDAMASADPEAIERERAQIQALTAQITAAIPQAREFAGALGDQALIAGLDQVELRLGRITTQVATTAQVNGFLTQSLTSGFKSFREAVAQGQNVLSSFGRATLQFAAQFLQQIADLILQAAVVRAIMATSLGKGLAGGINNLFNTGALVAGASALGTAGGIVTAAGTSITVGAASLAGSAAALQAAATTLLIANSVGGAGLFHSGGVVGSVTNRSRSVPSALFAAATRYHTGGIAGLRPDEVPAILRRREEVLTEGDPRHRLNGGLSGAAGGTGPLNLKIVNTLDAGEFVSQGASTEVGQQAIMNVIRANSGVISAMVQRA